MIFTSFEYAGFLLAVVAVNWLLPTRFRPAWLLAASLAFYASWSVPALAILVAICLLVYVTGRALPGLNDRARVVLTAVTVIIAAGSLAVFKILEAVGIDKADTGLAAKFIVPVGLSFFSFQAISYVLDVQRGEIEPSRSIIDVSLYLAFFPHLLAGPIVRAKVLIPKFHGTPRTPDAVQWAEAAELVLVGVFKKVALADPILLLCVSPFHEPAAIGPAHALVFLVAVLVGAYFDVTGYIDIARGSAKFLGIDMQRNALMPLTKSTGYADFWRRWQLTVMMWFRDYVYKPLRGPEHRAWREHLALFGTFFVLGIWHGFTLGWTLWGIASGLIIIAERSLQTRRSVKRRAQTKRARKERDKSLLPRPPNPYVSLTIALVLVMATFPLVAAGNWADTLALYRSIWRFGGTQPSADLLWMTMLGIIGVVVLDRREARREAKAGHRDPVTIARAVAFGVMVTGIIVYSGPAPQSFVYFAF
ncbi:MBOAT family O-acyltransferase [Aquihabitans sp. McL0605]|uniref:MBOAT family O-acyltransferase n=1 Tax=Aquihabitans sp. McL0605 TaxID=3415671 RepID=UPI003CE83C41